jgi:hypothetical protein
MAEGPMLVAIRVSALGFAIGLLLSGCAAQEINPPKETSYASATWIRTDGYKDDAIDALYGLPPKVGSLAPIDRNSAEELSLQKSCGISGLAPMPPAMKMLNNQLLLWVAGVVLEWGLDEIDQALAEELKKYVAAYKAPTIDTAFYQPPASGTASDIGLALPPFAQHCFRFLKVGSEVDAATGAVRQVRTLDLVVQLVPSERAEYMEIRPLRLFYAAPAFSAKIDNGKEIGVIVDAKIDAWWRQDNRSEYKTLFAGTILQKQVKAGAPPIIYDPAPPSRAQIVPISSVRGRQVGTTMVALTVSGTEAATPPKWLEKLSKLFHDNKGKLSDAVKKAMEKAGSSTADAN